MTAQPPLLLRRKTTKKQLISIYPKLEELLEANLVSVCVPTRVHVCVHVPCCSPPHTSWMQSLALLPSALS